MMRLNDLNDGSIKTLLILALLTANVAVVLTRDGGSSQLPGSARAARAVFGDFAENFSGSRLSSRGALGEARALPGEPPR